MKVLVLGHRGMLGHMVVKYLQHLEVNVITSNNRWPENQTDIYSFNGDYIINCIGAIPQRTDIFDINWQIPIWLDLHAPCSIIHPGTDRQDGTPYCISKDIAFNYIKQYSKQTKIIQTSIIGPEIQNRTSIFEWFISNDHTTVDGFDNTVWRGMTTLKWAKLCYDMMCNWGDVSTINTFNCYNSTISKYSLLNVINDVFDKKAKINKITDIKLIKEQLKELKEFYYDK